MPVVGICNGFQVLTEAGLLPGALQKNAGLSFVCKDVVLRVETSRASLTRDVAVGTELQIPINHFEGNYTVEPETLREILDNDQVVVRYVENPNGSVDSIAGVCNTAGNVVGLMPHPERASDALLGSEDGLVLLRAFLSAAPVSR
jgi:phosphoribosylformylglycinamidine synthase